MEGIGPSTYAGRPAPKVISRTLLVVLASPEMTKRDERRSKSCVRVYDGAWRPLTHSLTLAFKALVFPACLTDRLSQEIRKIDPCGQFSLRHDPTGNKVLVLLYVVNLQ